MLLLGFVRQKYVTITTPQQEFPDCGKLYLPSFSRTFAGMDNTKNKKRSERFGVRFKESEGVDFDKVKTHMREHKDSETLRRLVRFYLAKNGIK